MAESRIVGIPLMSGVPIGSTDKNGERELNMGKTKWTDLKSIHIKNQISIVLLYLNPF